VASTKQGYLFYHKWHIRIKCWISPAVIQSFRQPWACHNSFEGTFLGRQIANRSPENRVTVWQNWTYCDFVCAPNVLASPCAHLVKHRFLCNFVVKPPIRVTYNVSPCFHVVLLANFHVIYGFQSSLSDCQDLVQIVIGSQLAQCAGKTSPADFKWDPWSGIWIRMLIRKKLLKLDSTPECSLRAAYFHFNHTLTTRGAHASPLWYYSEEETKQRDREIAAFYEFFKS